MEPVGVLVRVDEIQDQVLVDVLGQRQLRHDEEEGGRDEEGRASPGLPRLRARLGDPAYAAAFDRGSGLTLDEVLELVSVGERGRLG